MKKGHFRKVVSIITYATRCNGHSHDPLSPGEMELQQSCKIVFNVFV